MTISEILKIIRKELHVSQEQLARDLNISFTTVNRWENNRSVPSQLAKMRLAGYCISKNIAPEIIDALNHVD